MYICWRCPSKEAVWSFDGFWWVVAWQSKSETRSRLSSTLLNSIGSCCSLQLISLLQQRKAVLVSDIEVYSRDLPDVTVSTATCLACRRQLLLLIRPPVANVVCDMLRCCRNIVHKARTWYITPGIYSLNGLHQGTVHLGSRKQHNAFCCRQLATRGLIISARDGDSQDAYNLVEAHHRSSPPADSHHEVLHVHNQQHVLKVALVGYPNAGKSELTNKLVGTKVTGVSSKRNTTITPHLGAFTEGHSQVPQLPGSSSRQQHTIVSHTLAWMMPLLQCFAALMVTLRQPSGDISQTAHYSAGCVI